jgi:hypothetical protein
MMLMKLKQLQAEIKELFNLVETSFGRNSLSYQNLDYYLDVLVTVYEYNYDTEKDLLEELKNLLLKLSKEIPELKPEQFKENYQSINEMIQYLNNNLTD